MKLRTMLIALAPLLVGVAHAQETSAVTSNEAAAQAPDKKLAALIQRYQKQQNDAYDAYEKAGTDEEKSKALAGLPGKEFVPEFRGLAEQARGTETAAQAWLWVLRLIESDRKQAWEVIQTLLEEHMQSTALAELSGQLRYGASEHGEDHVLEALRAMVAESPHESVRAGALFTLGAVLSESKKPANKTEGRDCFEAVVAEYPTAAYGGNSTYKAAAEGFLYELDHLQIGMPAPDFASVDENGAPWKLSDYKGKVVVVDFWGNW